MAISKVDIIHAFVIQNFIDMIIGNTIIISMSKIRKITAIRKKWIEKGNRLFDIGLKPHSNGVDFWLSIIDFFLIDAIITAITTAKVVINIKYINVRLITYF